MQPALVTFAVRPSVGETIEQLADGLVEVLDSARRGLAQEVLELGEELFDWLVVLPPLNRTARRVVGRA